MATPLVSLEARMQRFVATSPRIILGSASSSRRQIMDEVAQKYGFKYSVSTAGIDEKAIRYEEPRQLVLALAHAKRDAILAKMSEQERGGGGDGGSGPFLLTCDQVVVHAGVILEKPESEDECRRFIRGYATMPASTVGSVLVTDVSRGTSVEAVDVSTVHFSPIPDDVVDTLIAEGECMWCAGGLMRDAFYDVGVSLRGACGSAEPVSRLLSVARTALGLMCDVTRPSELMGQGGRGGADAGQTPVTLLGQHYLSHRELGSAHSPGGGSQRVYLQEICTFDAAEVPKQVPRIGREGAVPLASLHWWVDPSARVVVSRLGGRAPRVKVSLSGGGRVCFHAAGTPGVSAAAGGGPDQAGAAQEDYTFTLPNLVLHDPLSSACAVRWKGTMVVEGPGGGLVARLNLSGEGEVSGVLEARVSADAKAVRVGAFRGSLSTSVHVATSGAGLGMEGTVYDAASGAALITTLDLRALGPMRLPRLWSAIHDALLYADPALGAGGKAADALASALTSHLPALSFSALHSRDMGAPGGAAGAGAAAGPGGAAVAGGGGADNGSSSDDEQPPPLQTAGSAGAETRGNLSGPDTRAVPPCYKAERAAGKHLRYQLHCTLAAMPARL
ncbi:hypothetical protein FOA52_016165 [Chlamydomonas sp. UWO 241]|nr:hypothetical protein FOA52_016165 [Chlamydomonas sp. UWO 241]